MTAAFSVLVDGQKAWRSNDWLAVKVTVFDPPGGIWPVLTLEPRNSRPAKYTPVVFKFTVRWIVSPVCAVTVFGVAALSSAMTLAMMSTGAGGGGGVGAGVGCGAGVG